MELKEKVRLLRVRKTLKKKEPSFVRVESWRYKKLSKSGWRKQRGIDNKTRRKTKTGVISPEPGYRGPKAVRGIHPSGFEDKLVANAKELALLNPKIHGVRIASKLGIRKKMHLIELAQEKGFHIFNTGFSQEDLMGLDTLGAKEAEVVEPEDESEESAEDSEEEESE